MCDWVHGLIGRFWSGLFFAFLLLLSACGPRVAVGAVPEPLFEPLRAELNRLPGLQVVPMRPQRGGAPSQLMGRLQGVTGVFEAEAENRDGQRRVTIRLVDASTGAALWAGQFAAPSADPAVANAAIARAAAADFASRYLSRR